MFKGKSLTDVANLFLPNNFKNNDKVALSYFQTKINKGMKHLRILNGKISIYRIG